MVKQIREKLIKIIDSYTDEMAKFCQKLIQTRSVHDINPEKNVAKLIYQKAETTGLKVKYISKLEDRPNVIVEYGYIESPTLLFVGHMDTVPVGDENEWKHPPFAGLIENGKLYGRGAIDVKAGITAVLYAFKGLLESQCDIPGKLQFAAVSDEESGANSEIGLKYLLNQGIIKADSAVFVYPNTHYILNGHRGYIRFKLITEGEAVHTGSLRWEQGKRGSNAVTGMAELLLSLEKIRFRKSVSGAFKGRKVMITPGAMIYGGYAINIVPDKCEAWVDIRTLPGSSEKDILALVEKVANDIPAKKKGLKIKIEQLTFIPAAEISPKERIIQILKRNTKEILNKTSQVRAAGPANEGYMLINAGIPTVCGFGPDGDNIHGYEEYVDIKSMVHVAKIYALSALDYLNSFNEEGDAR